MNIPSELTRCVVDFIGITCKCKISTYYVNPSNNRVTQLIRRL